MSFIFLEILYLISKNCSWKLNSWGCSVFRTQYIVVGIQSNIIYQHFSIVTILLYLQKLKLFLATPLTYWTLCIIYFSSYVTSYMTYELTTCALQSTENGSAFHLNGLVWSTFPCSSYYSPHLSSKLVWRSFINRRYPVLRLATW